MPLLNQFTGRSDQSLRDELQMIVAWLDSLTADDELGGGSPLESTYERIDDLKGEIERRELDSKHR